MNLENANIILKLMRKDAELERQIANLRIRTNLLLASIALEALMIVALALIIHASG